MKIRTIHVENFKSFSEIDIELSQFNVVIGSNAAGKSNFISIFRFLRDIARNGVVNAVALQGGMENIRNARIGGSRDLVIRVVYETDPLPEESGTAGKVPAGFTVRSCISTYEFSLRFNESTGGFTIPFDRLHIECEVSDCGCSIPGAEPRPFPGKGTILVTNESGEIHYHVSLPEGCCLTQDDIVPLFFRGKRIREQTLLLETIFGYSFPHTEKFFDRTAVYDFDPRLSKKGVVITGKRELEEDAGNLALVIKNITEDPEKKRKFSNLLRDVLPFVEDFSVRKFMDVSLILTLRERYNHSRDLPASSLSDGTIIIFALIIALYFEDKPFIVVEEPVSHIHPFLISRLMVMMKEASAHKQVMVTTHSTEVVKHTLIEDLLLISRDSEGFSIISRPADEDDVRTFLENEIGIEDLFVRNLLGR
jgi:energy-coupling factor transporter ATP-binding protein EcfA2